MKDWGRPNLKVDVPTLESLSRLTGSEKLRQIFDEDFLKSLSDAQKAGGSGSLPSMKELFDNIEVAFKDLNLSKVEGIEMLKYELKRTDYGKMIGANWTLEYLGKKASVFKEFDRIIFESVEKIDEVTGTVVRRIDVKAIKNSIPTYFEFKSVQPPLPPTRFGEQFLRDLQLPQVTTLSQIKWIFDGKKVGSLVQKDFVDALEPIKTEIFNGPGRGLFERSLGRKFIDADDLIESIAKDSKWFTSVFERAQ